MFKSVICLSVTYVDLYCLLKSLATSGVCCMGRSGNTPLRALTICFAGHHPSSGVYALMSLRQPPCIIGQSLKEAYFSIWTTWPHPGAYFIPWQVHTLETHL